MTQVFPFEAEKVKAKVRVRVRAKVKEKEKERARVRVKERERVWPPQVCLIHRRLYAVSPKGVWEHKCWGWSTR